MDGAHLSQSDLQLTKTFHYYVYRCGEECTRLCIGPQLSLLVSIFLDASKAFDLVQHNLLFS